MTKLQITSLATAIIMAVAVAVVILAVPAKHVPVASHAKSSVKSKILKTPVKEKNSSTTKAVDTRIIESNVKTFFAANTSTSQRESLLQYGSQFAQVINTGFTQLNSEKPSVIINSVSYPGSKIADINFTVYLNGQPVLKNQSGQALLINNSWKVSDSTLCSLVSTIGQTPPVCENIH